MSPKTPLNSTSNSSLATDQTVAHSFPSELDREIAARLKLARESQNLSAGETAKRTGLPLHVYAELEAVQRRIDAWHLSKFAIAFDLPISWFFGQTGAARDHRSTARTTGSGAKRSSVSNSDQKIDELRQRLDDIRAMRKRV
nr:helix-turn-helix transcriptional regulator [Hyphomonas sp. Mor2]